MATPHQTQSPPAKTTPRPALITAVPVTTAAATAAPALATSGARTSPYAARQAAASPRVARSPSVTRMRSPSTPRNPNDPVRIGNIPVYIPTKASDKYSFLSLSKRHETHNGDWAALGAQQKWTVQQIELFDQAIDILQKSRLARMTHFDLDRLSGHSPHEQALISLHISRTTENFRNLFMEVGWDATLVTWLNSTLLDNVDRDLLEEYVEMLRNLRLSCLPIMEARGLLDGRGSRRLGGSTALKAAIARAPVKSASKAKQSALWSFDVEPIIVLAPGEHSWNSSYLASWKERIGALGKVVTCQESAQFAKDTKVMSESSLARSLTRKLQEVRVKWAKQPVVVIGMSVGATVAIEVSFYQRIDCLICLGLQMQGTAGNTAVAVTTENLLKLRPPTLFAIGSQSRLSSVSEMEKVRLEMQARNKLVIVRNADEALRIPLSKRMKVKLTQAMSDQLVLAEIGGFVKDALSNAPQRSAAKQKAAQAALGQDAKKQRT